MATEVSHQAELTLRDAVCINAGPDLALHRLIHNEDAELESVFIRLSP
jgi:hypothetical protein